MKDAKTKEIERDEGSTITVQQLTVKKYQSCHETENLFPAKTKAFHTAHTDKNAGGNGCVEQHARRASGRVPCQKPCFRTEINK